MHTITTSLSTFATGTEKFLAVGTKVRGLPGFNNDRNIFLQSAAADVTITPAGEGCVFIGIRGLRGAEGQLVPVWGRMEAGRGLVTEKDTKNIGVRKWKPVWIGESRGFHFQHVTGSTSGSTLYLGLTADGYPTLSNTPVIWHISEDDLRKITLQRLDHIWTTEGRPDLTKAEKTCFA